MNRKRVNTYTCSFNSQPPEGGCVKVAVVVVTTAVSTHSRPKAAAAWDRGRRPHGGCFNSQPPEGGCLLRVVSA